ncbi:secreted RxLR effector protein 161-like [Solanum lycopersicum]|uniref:secreted RxLR effector protein 161-like n=1 Tax=Solanum lycopersicum TaxID=4081 RepID=UPI003748AF38
MKDLGVARKIIGMEIIRDRERRKLFLSKRSYTQKVLARFSTAVNVVSRFMGKPGREHWQAVKRIFRYLRGTSDVDLIYGGDTQCLVTSYSDSYYARDVDTKRSMTGYVFTLGGSVVSWKATLRPTVTFSTTKVEYMALTEAAKEGIWLKGLVSDLAGSIEQVSTLFGLAQHQKLFIALRDNYEEERGGLALS